MTLRLSDLPAGPLRSQAEKALGVKRGNGAKKGGGSVAFKGWCHACGAVLSSGAAMERHRDENEGHARFVVYPPTPPRCCP